MYFIIFITGIFLVALLAWYYLLKSRKLSRTALPDPPDFPYIRDPALLTPYEQSFYSALIRVLDDQYSVFPKVGLANILSIDPELSERSLGEARKQIEQETVDFVLCEGEGTAILGVIQLDLYSQQTDGRRRYDSFTDQALKVAGVPIVRIPIKETYTEQELRIEITRSLVLNWGKNKSRDRQERSGEAAQSTAPVSDGQILGECPDCGSLLQIRQARRGKFAGKHLLACTRYPTCNNIRLIKEDSAMLTADS